MTYRKDIELISEARKVAREKCLVVAQTNTRYRGFFKSIRVYKKESDKGHPSRAIYESEKINKSVIKDIKSLPSNCKKGGD